MRLRHGAVLSGATLAALAALMPLEAVQGQIHEIVRPPSKRRAQKERQGKRIDRAKKQFKLKGIRP